MAHHTAYHFISQTGSVYGMMLGSEKLATLQTEGRATGMMFEQDAQGQIDQSGESLHDGSERSRPCQKPLFQPRMPVPPPKIE